MTASPGQVLIEQNATRQKIIVIDKVCDYILIMIIFFFSFPEYLSFFSLLNHQGCCRLQKKEKKSNKAVILTVLGKDEIAGEETFLGDGYLFIFSSSPFSLS